MCRFIFAYLLVFAFPLSQACDNEGCSEACTRVEFKIKPISDMSPAECQWLNLFECTMIHEAQEKCRCICDKRINNPDSEQSRNGGDGRPGNSNSNSQSDNSDNGNSGNNGNNDYDSSSSGKHNGCFHSGETVITNRGVMTMRQLSEIDYQNVEVEAFDVAVNKIVMSPVKYFIHAKPHFQSTFVNLHMQSGHHLKLTPQHLIYVHSHCDKLEPTDTIMAKHVNVGDCITVRANNNLYQAKVIGNQQTTETGIFSPVTDEGSIVVNDVIVSCYVYGTHSPMMDLTSTISNVMLSTFGVRQDGQVPLVWHAMQQLQKMFTIVL